MWRGVLCALALSAACRDPSEVANIDAAVVARDAAIDGADGGAADGGLPVSDARGADSRVTGSDGGGPDAGVVPAIGRPTSVDVICWNVRRFPSTAGTPAALADLVSSLQVDVVGLAEIDDDAAFAALVARLPGWQGFLGEGDGFIKMALLWRTAQVTVSGTTSIFESDFDFPRPPLVATLARGADTMTLIVVHHKAGLTDQDRARRRDANTKLAGWLDMRGNPKALVCGDFNEDLDASQAPDVYGAWLAAPTKYRILTSALDHGGATTFLPSPGIELDQMISTVALDSELGGEVPFIPRLDTQYPDYRTVISDHLPVALRLDLH